MDLQNTNFKYVLHPISAAFYYSYVLLLGTQWLKCGQSSMNGLGYLVNFLFRQRFAPY